MAVTAVGAAAQTTANLTVTATVIANCTVSTGTVAFGDYDPTASAAVDASGTFDVACTQGTLATVGLGAGQNALAGARRLLSGTSYLTYELYKDAARSAVWGAAGGATLALASAPSNAARTVTVYGRVAGAQNVPTGAYGDTVVISVTF
ncbi:MAG: spore coat protein U domain-containing protein [Acidobacteria bacterium]|nr:spore coat protein U domain-containing protein [Acidobacteriota bacterium]